MVYVWYMVSFFTCAHCFLIGKTVEFHRKGDYMIKREKYLQELIKAKDNGFPKVITGIRRCGTILFAESDL